MDANKINLALRFTLEMSGLLAFGLWGWDRGNDISKFVLALGAPIIAATIWGVFAVVDDPSRSGNAPIIVPGVVRLILELTFFILVVWALFVMAHSMLGWMFGMAVLVHYFVSSNRVIWLLRQ
jgi:hypothetical protein